MTIRKTAVYLRVSSREQEERQTIKTQRDVLARYAEQQNLDIVEIYADNGVSSSIPIGERPDGKRMMTDVASGKFNQILFYKLDRLFRNTVEAITVAEEMERVGVQLISYTEPVDLSTTNGRLQFKIGALFGEHEKEVIRDRIVAGKYRVAREGRHAGGIVLYGYALDEENRFIIDESTAANVRQIY